jgi:hypothetical protein
VPTPESFEVIFKRLKEKIGKKGSRGLVFRQTSTTEKYCGLVFLRDLREKNDFFFQVN